MKTVTHPSVVFRYIAIAIALAVISFSFPAHPLHAEESVDSLTIEVPENSKENKNVKILIKKMRDGKLVEVDETIEIEYTNGDDVVTETVALEDGQAKIKHRFKKPGVYEITATDPDFRALSVTGKTNVTARRKK